MTPEVPAQMHAGPWLDRLFPIHLPSGRMVSVKAFTVLPANIGILEGGLYAEANEGQREKIVAIAGRSHGAPLVVVEPRIVPLPHFFSAGYVRERYPWMACMARLASEPLDPDCGSSELTLVWWIDAFEGTLAQEIERAAAGIDWEKVAEDADLT